MKKKDILISDYPDEDANFVWDDEWVVSEKVCPKCKKYYLWEAGWYDDSEESGGANIGTRYFCNSCKHSFEH